MSGNHVSTDKSRSGAGLGSAELRVLLVGDAMGRPGREVLTRVLPTWRANGRAHVIIANGENSAAGKGITEKTAREMFEAGVDVITTGNHVWDNREVFQFIGNEPRVLRPANFALGMDIPGRGYGIFTAPGSGIKYAVVNLIGRVLMGPADCPFRTVRDILVEVRRETPIVFVDFHAEATSEKTAMGWFLDGLVTCVFGTHTHVLTADARLLHNGTAYITDIGMTGGLDSVIGMKFETVIDRFLRGMPAKYEVAERNLGMCGALVTVDTATGRAKAIEPVLERL